MIRKTIIMSTVFMAVLFVWPKGSFAFTSVGGTFDGVTLSMPCEVIPDIYLHTDGVFFEISSTTNITASGSYLYSDQSGLAFCQSYTPDGYQALPLIVLEGEPAGIYYFNVTYRNTGESLFPIQNEIYGIQFTWDGTTVTDYTYDAYYTHFYYYSPTGTVASTSPVDFYLGLYLIEDDYISGSFVRLKLARQTTLQAAVADPQALWTSYDFDDVITDGYNTLSTTTDPYWGDGVYLVKMELRKPINWWQNTLRFLSLSLYDPELVVASSSSFVYGEMTGFDKFVASTTSNLGEFYASSTLSIADAKKACSVSFDFSISDCLGYLFIGSPALSQMMADDIQNNLLTYVPIGYLTRAISILATTSTSSLPVLSYTFATSTQILPISGTFSFDPWQYFYTDGSPVKDDLKDNNGKNIWQIFEPIIKIIVYMTLFWMIIRDITSLQLAEKKKELK